MSATLGGAGSAVVDKVKPGQNGHNPRPAREPSVETPHGGSVLPDPKQAARLMQRLADDLATYLNGLVMALGSLGLTALDVIAGGIVLSYIPTTMAGTFQLTFAWVVTIVTSCLQLWLWMLIWSKNSAAATKGVAGIVVLSVMFLDTWMDAKFATLLLFGPEKMNQTNFVPQGVPLVFWWPIEILIILLVGFNEAIATKMRQLNKVEI